MCVVQGRQTRQNSGGVADLTKGGGVTKFVIFLRDKNINFLEFLRYWRGGIGIFS